jgi:glycolate oxidase FAD binding subunit
MPVDPERLRAGRVEVPASAAEAAGVLKAASGAGQTVLACGGGCFLDCGTPLHAPDVLLRTTALARTVFHEPGELVVRVQAGMTLSALQSLLATAGQEMPWDYPWPERQTVGGLLARGFAGPRRLGAGMPRDHVLGIEAVLADGSVVRPGGRVVKNVAGYDLTRLFVGSGGRLGILTEATLKVCPLPEDAFAATAAFGSPAAASGAVAAVLASALSPSFLELRGRWGEYTVAAGLEGLRESVAAGREALLGVLRGGGQVTELRGPSVRVFLADWTRGPWERPGFVARVCVPRSRLGAVLEAVEGPLVANAGNGVIRVAPGRELAPAEAKDLLGRLHALAVGLGGWAAQERGCLVGPTAEPGLSAGTRALAERVRLDLDPEGCLGGGRRT